MNPLEITTTLKAQLKRRYGITDLKDFIEWHILFADTIEKSHSSIYSDTSFYCCDVLNPEEEINQ